MTKNIALFIFTLLLNSASWAADVSPMTIEGATSVTTEQAKALFDSEALFVDVRKDSDWDAGRIPGAIQLDIKGKFTEEALSAEAGKSDKIVIYCNGEKCLRSSEGSKQAVGWGFTNVHYYRDGFPAWKAAGYPVE